MVSPVVRSDVKHCGYPPFLYTSVVFQTDEEIDELVVTLRELKTDKAGKADWFRHVHLQDYQLDKNATAEKGEITFFGPRFHSSSDDEAEEQRSQRSQFAGEARRFLEAQ